MKLYLSVIVLTMACIQPLYAADATTSGGRQDSTRVIPRGQESAPSIYEKGFVSSRYSCNTYPTSGLSATSVPTPPSPCNSNEVTTNVYVEPVQKTEPYTVCTRWGCRDNCDWYDASCGVQYLYCEGCVEFCGSNCSCGPKQQCTSSRTTYRWSGEPDGAVMTTKLLCATPGWVIIGSLMPTPSNTCTTPAAP